MKEKLEHLHLKDRLQFGYRTVIVLMFFSGILSLAVTWLLLASMNNFANKIQRADTAVKVCRIDVNIAARNIREMALNPDTSSYAGYREQVDAKLAEIGAELEAMKQTGVVEDGLYLEYEEALTAWGTIGYEIMNDIEAGRDTEAVDAILTECVPALDRAVAVASDLENYTDERVDNAVLFTTALAVTGIVGVIAFILIAVVLSMRVGNIIIRSITIPLHEIKNVAEELAAGNLHSNVDYRSEDEIGILAHSLRKSIRILSSYVDDIDRAMREFSLGNFDVQPEVEWKGDFIGILNSFMMFEESMGDTIKGVREASRQVSGGSEQVAASAQDLASGATDQAAVVEQLTATIASVADRVSRNAERVSNISGTIESVGGKILDGNEKMHEMAASMHEINESSKEIGKIIATINEIAAQTNLLALNASIEAARAGEAGKGFAVVADQVTVLAAQSASAAKESADLIGTSVKAVEKGMQIAEQTAEQLEDIADNSKMIVVEVNEIVAALKEQTGAIWQINDGVDHINDVVQSNSAASEECAAASEEMSSEATSLEELIGRFKISES